MISGWDIFQKIALRWMSLDLIDDKSTLVQVMAWCRQATSHYLSQCWPRLPYGVTRPQWVKVMVCWLPLLSHNLKQCLLSIENLGKKFMWNFNQSKTKFAKEMAKHQPYHSSLDVLNPTSPFSSTKWLHKNSMEFPWWWFARFNLESICN